MVNKLQKTPTFKDIELLHLILDTGAELTIKGKDLIEVHCKSNYCAHQNWCSGGVYQEPEQDSFYTKNFILITKTPRNFHSSDEDMGLYVDIKQVLQMDRNIIKVRFEFTDNTYQEFFIKEHTGRRLGKPNKYQLARYNKDGNFILTICKND